MKKFIKRLLLFILIAALLISAAVCIPIIKQGKDMYVSATTKMSIDEKIAQIKSDEDYTTIDNISPDFRRLLVASEDKDFYKHNGIDISAIIRAALINIRERALVEGGSTITQQLSKNMYYTFDKVFSRKVAEVYTAFDIEKAYSKDEILELYCNVVYFGEGCYGIGEACEYYYGCSPIEITETQAQMLVDTLKAPSVYNPETME